MKNILQFDIKNDLDVSKYSNSFVVAALIIVFILIARGLLSNYSVQQKRITQEIKRIEEKKDLVKKWEAVAKEYKVLSDDFVQNDPSLLKKILEQSARKANIRITSFRSSRKDADPFIVVMLRLKADSSYENLVKFLQLVEDKGIEVDSAKLSRKDNKMTIEELVLKGYILKK